MTDRPHPTTVPYAPQLAFLTTPLARSLALSLGFHLLLFLSWPKPAPPPSEPAPMVVSLAPPADDRQERPTPLPKEALARTETARAAPAKIAKQDAPPTLSKHEPVREAAPRKDKLPETVRKDEPPPIPAPPTPSRPNAREEIPEKTVIAERELPTVNQLLPPLYSSDGGGNRARVPLETKEPQYVSYFNSIKRSIDANWKYPELALRYGLQGRLIVEFEISENGQLDGLRVIRSSGSSLLDEEAVRAIRSAAPFAPIPRWIEQKPLAITARMEYHDGRLTRPAR